MELPRLATVCLVVATALAETVNFWASMANGCVEECGATRARRRITTCNRASDRVRSSHWRCFQTHVCAREW